MNVFCKHCNAKPFNSEKISNKGLSFSDCCGHGSVVLDATPTFPDELSSMFNNSHPYSHTFFKIFEVIIIPYHLHHSMQIYLIFNRDVLDHIVLKSKGKSQYLIE